MIPKHQKVVALVLLGVALVFLILLILAKINIDQQDVAVCENLHPSERDQALCPVHTGNASWFITVLFGLAFVVLGTGVYLLFIQGREEKTVKVDFSKLDEDEKRVYTLLKERDGSLYQSDLVKETGFSKVKMTRLLDKMAAKNIIDRKRRGMTNIIVLK